jgi:hypothetical protein
MIAKTKSRIFGAIDFDIETLKTIVIFCGAGLAASLMCFSYRIDLSLAFF